MISYREIEERCHTQTDSVCGGYPERGPFGDEQKPGVQRYRQERW